MAWTATLNIVNDTDYNLTVNHNTVGDLTTIAPGGSWSWTTSDPNNTNALRFWQTPGQWYMQGSVAYGPLAGVCTWIAVGWHQTIRPSGWMPTCMVLLSRRPKTVEPLWCLGTDSNPAAR